MDLIGSTILFISFIYIDASVYLMFRGSSIFFTAFYSRMILKRKLLKCHYFGMIMMIIGLIFIGLANFIFSDTEIN